MNVIALVPGWGELLIAAAVGLLLFGGRLPQVAKDMGRTFFRFRNSLSDLRRESGIEDAIRDIKEEASHVVDKEMKNIIDNDDVAEPKSGGGISPNSESVDHSGD